MLLAPSSAVILRASPVVPAAQDVAQPLDLLRQHLDRDLAEADARNEIDRLVELMEVSREVNRLRYNLSHNQNPAAQAALAATAARFAEKAHSGFHLFSEEVAA